jgi:hypothetical protein
VRGKGTWLSGRLLTGSHSDAAARGSGKVCTLFEETPLGAPFIHSPTAAEQNTAQHWGNLPGQRRPHRGCTARLQLLLLALAAHRGAFPWWQQQQRRANSCHWPTA